MKEKTKKILAGIGLGICSAFTLTACTSDITFNQSDLDNVINGANQYLETQNNYSSEFARNMLNDFLIKSLYASATTTSATINSTSKGVDEFGNVLVEEYTTEKYYLDADSNKTKQSYVSKDADGNIKYNGYREIIYDADASDVNERYKVKTYDLIAETYTDFGYRMTEEIGSIRLQGSDGHEMGISEIYSINKCIMYTLDYLNSYKLLGDITMETISENEYMFYFITDMSASSEFVYRGNISVRIKDGRLVAMEAITTIGECITSTDEILRFIDINGGFGYSKVELEWGTADFTVDTSKCTLVTEE